MVRLFSHKESRCDRGSIRSLATMTTQSTMGTGKLFGCYRHKSNPMHLLKVHGEGHKPRANSLLNWSLSKAEAHLLPAQACVSGVVCSFTHCRPQYELSKSFAFLRSACAFRLPKDILRDIPHKCQCICSICYISPVKSRTVRESNESCSDSPIRPNRCRQRTANGISGRGRRLANLKQSGAYALLDTQVHMGRA